jgi:hypothetical protein
MPLPYQQGPNQRYILQGLAQAHAVRHDPWEKGALYFTPTNKEKGKRDIFWVSLTTKVSRNLGAGHAYTPRQMG